jgi:hypothetical protein
MEYVKVSQAVQVELLGMELAAIQYHALVGPIGMAIHVLPSNQIALQTLTGMA